MRQLVLGAAPTLRAGTMIRPARTRLEHRIGKIELLSVRKNENARDHLQMPLLCRDPFKYVSGTYGKTPGKTTHARHVTLLTRYLPQ